MSHHGEPAIRRKTPAEVHVPDRRVRVLESHHSAQFEMEMGAWPFHKICWVAVGRGKLDFGAGQSTIRRADFLLLPSGWKHRFVDEPGAPLTLVILCVSAALMKDAANPEREKLWQSGLGRHARGDALRARTAFHYAALVEIFRRALREQAQKGSGWETVLRTLADELIVRIARGEAEPRTGSSPSAEQAVSGAVEFMDAHVCDAFQIPEMAERCGLSPRRFTELFKKNTGQTFVDYLNRQRIEHACDRLRETGHILYACYESGFNDPAYFYRVFKKHTGKTPGQFLAAVGDA